MTKGKSRHYHDWPRRDERRVDRLIGRWLRLIG